MEAIVDRMRKQRVWENEETKENEKKVRMEDKKKTDIWYTCTNSRRTFKLGGITYIKMNEQH